MNKIAEIEKLKKELEKEGNSENPDVNLINKLKKQIIQIGMGLTLNDINKR